MFVWYKVIWKKIKLKSIFIYVLKRLFYFMPKKSQFILLLLFYLMHAFMFVNILYKFLLCRNVINRLGEGRWRACTIRFELWQKSWFRKNWRFGNNRDGMATGFGLHECTSRLVRRTSNFLQSIAHAGSSLILHVRFTATSTSTKISLFNIAWEIVILLFLLSLLIFSE